MATSKKTPATPKTATAKTATPKKATAKTATPKKATAKTATSPALEAPTSPAPVVPTSPAPVVPTSPAPEAPTSPAPEAPTSPAPEAKKTVSMFERLAPNPQNVSDKYVVIDSQKLVNELQARGFELRSIMARATGTGQHVIRMRAANDYKAPNGETLFPEVVIKNSYNGKSSFCVQMGIFRLVCSNGLTILDNSFGSFTMKTRHVGDEAKLAEQITFDFIENLASVWQVQERMATKILTEKQAIQLAMKAAEARWKKTFTAEEAAVLLKVARPEDAGLDAWSVYNRLQENVLNGGIKVGDMKREPKAINYAKKHAKVNEAIFEAAYALVEPNKVSKVATVDAVQAN